MRQYEALAAVIFLLPSLVGFVLFMAGPIVASFGIALTDWPLIRNPRWVGFANFQELMRDAVFWQTLANTAVYTFVKVPVNILLSLVLAVLMNERIVGRGALRTLFFLPMVMSSVAVGMIWRPILDSSSLGLMNRMLEFFSLGPIPWLASTEWAMPSLIGIATWKELGYFMVIFLAGIQGIPRTYYEAAEIDGAGPIRQFISITVPLVSPTTLFVLITSIIGSFQIFDLSSILTAGGPANATNTLVMYVYQAGFRFLRMGYGSAVAIALFVVILVLTVFQNALSKRWVHVD